MCKNRLAEPSIFSDCTDLTSALKHLMQRETGAIQSDQNQHTNQVDWAVY